MDTVVRTTVKKSLLALGIAAAAIIPVVAYSQSALERVIARGELVIATLNGPTTFYEGANGPTGFEYDLAQAFAGYLGVKLRVVTPDDHTRVFPMIGRGEADVAVGFTITELRAEKFRFGPTYQEVTQQLLYCAQGKQAATIEDTVGARLEVMAASSHVERLMELKQDHPGIAWMAHEDLSSDELIELLCQGSIDYTVANSNMVALNKRFYPDLSVAFNLAPPQPLAWAFASTLDRSLYRKAAAFFAQVQQDGSLEQIANRYYGHARYLNYVGVKTFMENVTERLPEHRNRFLEAAAPHALDWRLLAAVSYQESMWDAAAESPTGVRGLMMLTMGAASDLGIEDRSDPEQSVSGGAEYFILMRDRIPERVPEPDRTWLALAAYNVGFGHLEDARVLTQETGGDPDKWIDVKERLPLLTQRKWYAQTSFGYARGFEPVHYVQNIRNYYDMLVWFTDREESGESLQADAYPEERPPTL